MFLNFLDQLLENVLDHCILDLSAGARRAEVLVLDVNVKLRAFDSAHVRRLDGALESLAAGPQIHRADALHVAGARSVEGALLAG